ncbi:hypothetical protein ACIA98_32540 [Streptomyces sp. NPDC051366]|uniref:hypothetical protein n=1 Tax=Streptomyces sp. NPDC051366 TaxID=3365652 RepID=UPI0037A26853
MVSGIGAASLDVVKGFYDGLVQTTVPVSAPKVAELIKNTFRHVNITLVNEMAMLAKPPGVKIWEAIQAGPVALQSVDRARDCVALAVVGLVGRHGSRVSGGCVPGPGGQAHEPGLPVQDRVVRHRSTAATSGAGPMTPGTEPSLLSHRQAGGGAACGTPPLRG